MDLINPSPQVFERKETDRKAVSGRLYTVTRFQACSVCQITGLLFHLLNVQRTKQELAEDARDPIDALEIFEVRRAEILSSSTVCLSY